MRLICPSCGAIHSAEAWENDADMRQVVSLKDTLPQGVSRLCFPYLKLFRPLPGPGKAPRGLLWPKALRLISELKDMVDAPYIQWKNHVARPNTSKAWAMAMERLIEQPPKRLPLKSHGYLRAIAYEIADEIDREAEKNNPNPQEGGRTTDGQAARFSVPLDEMKKIRNQNMGGTR